MTPTTFLLFDVVGHELVRVMADASRDLVTSFPDFLDDRIDSTTLHRGLLTTGLGSGRSGWFGRRGRRMTEGRRP